MVAKNMIAEKIPATHKSFLSSESATLRSGYGFQLFDFFEDHQQCQQ